MKIRELLQKKPQEVLQLRMTESVGRAVRMLMGHGIGALPIVDGERLVGLVSERDVVQALDTRRGEDVRTLPVRQIMRSAAVCSPEDDVRLVMARMTGERARHLVVLEGERIVGIVSVGDIVKHRQEELETEASVLRDVIAGQRAG